MPLTVSATAVNNPAGVRLAHGRITFDNSYATGGEALVAADLGLARIDFLIATPRAAGYIVQWDKTNNKLLVYKSGNSNVKTFKAAGAAAGNVTVTGIATTDTLLSVLRLDRDATAANIDLGDLTSEFTISAADTINNAAGTNTTGDSLYVVVARPSSAAAPLEVANAVNLSALVVDVLAFQLEGALTAP